MTGHSIFALGRDFGATGAHTRSADRVFVTRRTARIHACESWLLVGQVDACVRPKAQRRRLRAAISFCFELGELARGTRHPSGLSLNRGNFASHANPIRHARLARTMNLQNATQRGESEHRDRSLGRKTRRFLQHLVAINGAPTAGLCGSRAITRRVVRGGLTG